MSEKLPEPQASEEVDLGQLFNAIGKLFDRFISFISSIFKFVFSVFIYAIKAIIDNIKLITIVVLASAIIGYALEKTKTKRYESVMLVRTYFDAKYQLATNIKYYNALLNDKDYKALESVFNISEQKIKDVISFEIEIGPETENERIVEYDIFIKSIDSVRAQEISYEDFIENRNLFSGNLFEIIVESKDKKIFKNLEEGIYKSFKNAYSRKKMEKRDSMISIQRQNISKSLTRIDSLGGIYVSVLKEESKSTNARYSLADGIPLQQEKTQTREYELLEKGIRLRKELSLLDEQQIEENVFFDVVSSFQKVGNVVKKITDRFSLIFPILSFILLCLGFCLRKFTFFVKNYEE